MSIQTEINRLSTAKNDLKTALTAKGVTVPSGTRLDGYSALLAQVPGADAYLDKATYDPGGFKRDLFAEIGYLYKATFLLDGWSGSGPYTQTVTAIPVDGGPGVTAGSQLLSSPLLADDLAGSCDAVQAAALVAAGKFTPGAGTLSCTTNYRPTADVEVYLQIQKGGA